MIVIWRIIAEISENTGGNQIKKKGSRSGK
jgi:hypothetical protein